MTGSARPLGRPTKLAYGFGAVAYGVKDNGFAYFLMIYYNQVLGLPVLKVAAAGFVALCVDALSDPFVGNWSDRLHSRWGRRHPFMYAAAIPVALSFFFLWNPPSGLTQDQLLVYLVVIAVLVRTCITFYEVPSTSMVAELTGDYHQRTSLLSYRYLFGWIGGLAMALVAFRYLLVPGEGHPYGILNPEGYHKYGAFAAMLMLTGIMISALGTHHRIPQMKKPPPKKPLSVRRTFAEMFETLSDRSFVMLFLAALTFALAQGLYQSLNYYFATYFWELKSHQLVYFIYAYVGSALLAFVLAPRITARLGKKRAAIGVSLVAFGLAPMPIFLRLAGFFPENHTPALLPTLLAFATFDVALIITSQIIVGSMIADVVEESELKTGRRSEGLFFAARTFIHKIVSGLGLFTSGVILALVAFPANAVPGAVDAAIIRNLGLVYAPILLVFFLMSVAFLTAYRIDQARHEDNLKRLSDRSSG